MLGMALKMAKWFLALLSLFVFTFFAVRIYNSQRGLPLDVWHTYVPQELSKTEIDAADWGGYLEAEAKIFASLRTNVSQQLTPEEQVPFNRYFEGSPVYPGHFTRDWNRSYLLEPAGPPIGAVVLLHGLTDSPYSLRHIATRYRDRGFVVVAIRLPAHGTVPAALTDVEWETWLAATRLAVREARRRAPEPAPLHVVGFSNGGSLAVKYTLDAIDDERLSRVDRLVLLSPMVGITRFARFAGLAGLPAILPAFAKAAWLSVLPEFNPFKYNSFPVNGARQSYLLTDALGTQMSLARREGRLTALPPVLTFQSVMDFTVSTQAVLSGLYDHLPANGSELVLFDLNRNVKFGPLLRASAESALSRIVPPRVRDYRLTVVTNAGEGTEDAVERVVEAGATAEQTQALGLQYPKGVYSLSHVALPFPLSDSLYGLTPDQTDDFGVHLGSLAPRGERGTLIVSLDALLRMSSNPFFSYMAQRIEEHLPARPDGDATDQGGARVQSPPQAAPPPRRLPSAAPDTPAAASSDRPAKKRSHR
ncbi:carboxylesterase [Methylocystis sp.]|uniref:alpha/beta hydrolase n=1 Tax=Methylocystis sp. TaxID=1911079 RepID=UPI002733CCFA|nr:alpha/beta hydrolase [Methylocystis sp.]MDP3553887.1 alpha/beta hydrolase [Methylocystis sp.]